MSDIPIKVEVIRSGGFAGIERRTAVDTGQLPADHATEVRALVQQLAPAALSDPAATAAAGSAPDRFQYDVAIQIGDDVHRFSVGEEAAPSDLKSLLDAVMKYGSDG